MPSRHTNDTKAKALELYTNTKMNLKEVCTICGIKTTCTLTRWLRKAGITVRTSTKHHSQAYKNYARSLYKEGKSSYQIGKMLKVNPKTIQHWVKDLVKDWASKKKPQHIKDEARRLYLDGKTYEQIRKLIGIGRTTAHRWCKQFERERSQAHDRAA